MNVNQESTELFTNDGEHLLPSAPLPPAPAPPVMTAIDVAKYVTLSGDEYKRLSAPVDENEVQIKPNGIIFLPWESTARRLNEVIGVGQWVLHSPTWKRDGNFVIMQAALYVRGCYVDTVYGQCEYHESNDNMSLMDAVKGAKSDCITNAGKTLGVHIELWNPNFIRTWTAKHAVLVWRRSKPRPVWRRKDHPPFDDEYTPQGAVPTSPATTPPVVAAVASAAAATEKPRTGELSAAQVKRLLAIGNKYGYDRDALLMIALKKYNVGALEDLPRKAYDALCGKDDAPGLLAQNPRNGGA